MALNRLFEIKNGRATITDHCYTNVYFKTIIDTFGEMDAVKIFTVFQYMADLNPETNPYVDVSEVEKLEVVIRACAPDLPLEVDWNDETFEEGIELTRKMFETGTYRAYLALKTVRDRLTDEMNSVSISMYKDDGNVGEVKKALEVYETINEATRKAFSEFEAENGSVQRKGGRKAVTRTIGGKAIELE